MKSTKALFLFLALILPVCIFLFLKFFGRNEFEVQPLFFDAPPSSDSTCLPVTAPYVVHDSVMSYLGIGNDSLVVAFMGEANTNSSNQIKRITDEVPRLPVTYVNFSGSERYLSWKRCVFFLDDSKDIVVVDRQGRIRGQYISTDREDVDRLFTELTIILKRY
jgi:hypothetical protein